VSAILSFNSSPRLGLAAVVSFRMTSEGLVRRLRRDSPESFRGLEARGVEPLSIKDSHRARYSLVSLSRIWPHFVENRLPNTGSPASRCPTAFAFSGAPKKRRLHFLICIWCQRYEEQLRYIHQTAGRFPERADEASDILFPPDAKERIKRKLAD
jgi:hypothetical protein